MSRRVSFDNECIIQLQPWRLFRPRVPTVNWVHLQQLISCDLRSVGLLLCNRSEHVEHGGVEKSSCRLCLHCVPGEFSFSKVLLDDSDISWHRRRYPHISACSVPVSRVIPAYAALRLKRFVDSLLLSPPCFLPLGFFLRARARL